MLKYYIYIHNIFWYILVIYILIYAHIYIYIHTHTHTKNNLPSCRKSQRPDQATWEGHWTHVIQSWCPVSTNLDWLVLFASRSTGKRREWTSVVCSWHSIEVVVHAQWLALLQGLSGSLVPIQSKSWYPFCIGGQWGSETFHGLSVLESGLILVRANELVHVSIVICPWEMIPPDDPKVSWSVHVNKSANQP